MRPIFVFNFPTPIFVASQYFDYKYISQLTLPV